MGFLVEFQKKLGRGRAVKGFPVPNDLGVSFDLLTQHYSRVVPGDPKLQWNRQLDVIREPSRLEVSESKRSLLPQPPPNHNRVFLRNISRNPRDLENGFLRPNSDDAQGFNFSCSRLGERHLR
jgi:hypothetical protein